MKIFDLDVDDVAQDYARQGWVHIRSGVTQEFLDYARTVVREAISREQLQGAGIAGAKTQWVFDLPEFLDWEQDLLDVVAGISGLRRETLTLSERHIKAYLPDADPRPLVHKDRFASGIALGITLDVGPESHVVLYPEDQVWANPHLTASLRAGLAPWEQPERLLSEAREVTIHDAPGDVLAFPGASVWHLRRNAASTVLLYLKFNDLGCDPLGEDPTTDLRRSATLDLLAEGASLEGAVPVLARRFDSVGVETGRAPGRRTWHVNVWEGDQRVCHVVPRAYAELLEAIEGDATLVDLVEQGRTALSGAQLAGAVSELARLGALDLLTPGEHA